MRYTILVSVFALAMLPAASEAAIVSYSFTANVSSIFTHVLDSDVFTQLTSADIPGANIHMRDAIRGQFAYETDTQPGFTLPSYASYSDPLQSFSFSFLPSGAQFTAVSNGAYVSYGTGYKISNFAGVSGDVIASIGLTDISDGAGNNYALPENLSLSRLFDAEVIYSWHPVGSSTTLFIYGRLTTLAQVSSVPEPQSWAMLGIGAALMAGVARRRQRRGARQASE